MWPELRAISARAKAEKPALNGRGVNNIAEKTTISRQNLCLKPFQFSMVNCKFTSLRQIIFRTPGIFCTQIPGGFRGGGIVTGRI